MPEDGDELLEVVNESGEVIGRATRARCHADPSLIHRAVHLLLFDPAGRLYLQKRSARKLIQPGKWDTSVGGHLAPGETPEAAVRREAEEEVGLRDLELTPLHEYLWRSSVETELVTSFRATHNGDPIRLDPDEIEEGRYFAAAELRALAAAGQLTPNLLRELDRIGLLPASVTGAGA
jgi:isopentenyl-diphosphate delta-isomerase type 1